MRRHAALFVLTVIFLGWSAEGARPQTLPDMERLVAQFNFVMAQPIASDGRGLRKRKRGDTMAISIERLPLGQTVDAEGLRRLSAEIGKVAGVRIAFESIPGGVRFIHATRQDFFNAAMDAKSMLPERYDVVRHSCVVRANVGYGGYMESTNVAIVLDPGPAGVAACQTRGLLGALGILGQGCAYRPSIFCPYGSQDVVTPADQMLLRAFYDDRLKLGMTSAEALNAATVVLRDMYLRGS